MRAHARGQAKIMLFLHRVASNFVRARASMSPTFLSLAEIRDYSRCKLPMVITQGETITSGIVSTSLARISCGFLNVQ